MDWVAESIQKLDIANLIAMTAIMWVGYSRLDKKIEKLDKKIEKSESVISSRLDKMQETITDIDRRLCRLEGAFQSKECCLLKSDSSHQKAE